MFAAVETQETCQLSASKLAVLFFGCNHTWIQMKNGYISSVNGKQIPNHFSRF
jgi:hypothetical protein